MADFGLGARFIEDPRDASYPLRALHEQLGVAEKKPPKKKSWLVGTQLDQGQTSACVGFSIEGLLLASPIRQHYQDGAAIYHAAQQVDEWPGDQYDGTSVRAGLKVVQDAGYVGSYYWAINWETVRQQIAFVGPMILAVTWLNSMFNPDTGGNLVVDQASGVAGGHAILCHGYDGERLHLRQSWGPGWGQKGGCWLSRSDWETLMGMQGEAVAVSEVKGG